jgi:hypothetical protein
MHFRFNSFRHLSVRGEKGCNLRINSFKCIDLFLVEKWSDIKRWRTVKNGSSYKFVLTVITLV